MPMTAGDAMNNPINSVELLVRLKAAVDLVRDVRAEDEPNREKIRLAMAELNYVMQALQINKPG